MQKKTLIRNLIYFIIFFFLVSCRSVPKYPSNACKIFGQRYLWYKHVKKSSETYGAPIHIILAFVKKESGFNKEKSFCCICGNKLGFVRYNPKNKWEIKGFLCKNCWDDQKSQNG